MTLQDVFIVSENKHQVLRRIRHFYIFETFNNRIQRRISKKVASFEDRAILNT